ncbi:methyltransferase domain-containing protein [bacterium]|nr:methyltransferase domain-containing protein [candidate division CSSED10-310 bacterium]
MTLDEFFSRNPVPEPWQEGDNIPWHEPEFSRRMLREHYCQDHDRASRRYPIIDAHVAWIDRVLLHSRPSRILDLGCGPGFYSSRLAALGHPVTGIDYSPASIASARESTTAEPFASPVAPCRYFHADIRSLSDYRQTAPPYDLIMMLYGEINVFNPADARTIVQRCSRALAPGGLLLLEPQTYDAVRDTGLQPAFWSQAAANVWSDSPHFLLEEYFWNSRLEASTIRYFVLDPITSLVTPYAQTFQAWSTKAIDNLLVSAGFDDLRFYPRLAGVMDETGDDLMAVVARFRGDQHRLPNPER